MRKYHNKYQVRALKRMAHARMRGMHHGGMGHMGGMPPLQPIPAPPIVVQTPPSMGMGMGMGHPGMMGGHMGMGYPMMGMGHSPMMGMGNPMMMGHSPMMNMGHPGMMGMGHVGMMSPYSSMSMGLGCHA